MKLNTEKIETQRKNKNTCEVKPVNTVEGKYKVLICENKKINDKSK